jgi:hypothetical protein
MIAERDTRMKGERVRREMSCIPKQPEGELGEERRKDSLRR